MPSVLYGDVPVPIWRGPWQKSTTGVDGFRMISELRPGQHWSEARVEPNMVEGLADVDGEALPVGVAIAANLIRDGADWAYCTELFSNRPLVLLDHTAHCVAVDGPVGVLVDSLAEANGSLAGLPDVIASCGDVVVFREAKQAKKDRLTSTQHAMARTARRIFGFSVDLAVIEWNSHVRRMLA